MYNPKIRVTSQLLKYGFKFTKHDVENFFQQNLYLSMYSQKKRRPHSKYPVNKTRAPYIYNTDG